MTGNAPYKTLTLGTSGKLTGLARRYTLPDNYP